VTSRPAGGHGEKPNETLVRLIVQRSLGVRVCCYDDRDGSSKPDAIVHRRGGVPLEIVSDPHKADVQLLSALDKIDRRTEFAGLRHGYWVSLTHKARVKDLRWLETLLRQLEDPVQRHLVPSRADEYEFITPVNFLRAGEVRLSSGSGGGRPMPSPDNVVAAACAVLAQPAYADVSRKLSAHGGAERHAALIVDEEKDATFDWLREAGANDVDRLPQPVLSGKVTHLWITSRYQASLTIGWSKTTGWQGFEWAWGHPADALADWDDPECHDDHAPGSAR
jgi:hypothetical protein